MRRPFDAEPVVAALARGELPFDELAIRIDRDGRWWHRGEPIARPELVRLLASVLHRDAEGGYWLVTPAERGRVEVEDVPFLAVELARERRGVDGVLELRTNLDEWVPLDRDHPLRIAAAGTGPIPYVRVRGRLEARIVPSVYYELAELAVANEDGRLGVWSAGSFFPLEPEAAARG